MEDGADHITQSDPIHPLASAAQFASEPEPKERQHPLERTSFARQDHSKAKMHDADSKCTGLRSFCLPGDAGIGDKPPAGIRFFGKDLVASVAVNTGGGCAQEN